MPKREFAVYKRHEDVLRIRPPVRTRIQESSGLTANEQFKQTFRPAVGAGCVLAMTLHFAAINMAPPVRTAEARTIASSLDAVEIPPRVTIPSAPEAVARPARPRLAEIDLDQDVTISPTTFDSFEPVTDAAVAPPAVVANHDDRPEFIPYDEAPRLLNGAEMIAMLEKVYPNNLRNAGIDGTVILWIQVDSEGRVTECRIGETSGFEGLDEAARIVAHSMEFKPALVRDKPVGVWIRQPVDFISN